MSAVCATDDLDALISPACAASALTPAIAGAVVLVLSAVRLGQLSAGGDSQGSVPARTAWARTVAMLASLIVAAACLATRWDATGSLERAAWLTLVAGWALALPGVASRTEGGAWHTGLAAIIAVAAAVPTLAALVHVGPFPAATDPPASHVAAAWCFVAAALAQAAAALSEVVGLLPRTEQLRGLSEPLLDVVAGEGEAGAPARHVCPERGAGFFSRVMFTWMGPVLAVGEKRPIEEEDLWDLDMMDRSKFLGAQWAKSPKGSTAAKALAKVVGPTFLAGGVYRLLSDVSQLATPVVLNLLLAFLEEPPGGEGHKPVSYGVLLGMLLFASQLGQSIFDNQYFWRVLRSGMQARVVLVNQVTAKVLRLSHRARADHTTGRLNALIAADAEAVELCLGTLHLCWSAVLRILVALLLLYLQLGAPAFAALGTLLLMVPLQTSLVIRSARAQKRALQHTDERVKAFAEAVGAITTLKCYAWEEPALNRVLAIRQEELNWLRVRVSLNALNFAMISLNVTLMAAATFSVYTLAGGVLDASTTFTSIALFGNLQGPLFLVPQAISQLVSARVSLKRLDELLLADELQDAAGGAEFPQLTFEGGGDAEETAAGHAGGSVPLADAAHPVAVEVRGADFAWDADGTGKTAAAGSTSPLLSAAAAAEEVPTPTLLGVELRVSRGCLLAVVGGTGEGKSSLLAAILGDMPALQPERGATVRGSVAYCAQQSWIFSGTVRENVIFGRPFDERRYEEALWASDLGTDLEQMGGDDTEIGERGLNVSGGQKQRISLARAFYADADIYILDDVLSALDAAVAAKIFDRYLARGMRARGKTVIFSTNRLEFVSACDEVVVMQQGRIADTGPVADVRERCAPFAQMMASTEAQDGDVDSAEAHRQPQAAAGPGAHAAAEASRPMDATGPGAAAQPNGTGASASGGTAGATSAAGSGHTAAPPPARTARRLVEAEHRDTGQLSWAVVVDYLKAAGGVWVCTGIFSLYALKTGTDYASNWWLSQWSAASGPDSADGGAPEGEAPFLGGRHSSAWWLCGYLLVQLCGVCATLTSQLCLALGGLRASRHLAARLATAILSAPTSFFHANPSGRLINVATKDQRDVDQVLVSNLAITLMISLSLAATLIVVISSLWWTIFVIMPLVYFFYRTRSAYQRSLIEIKRWGAVTRSPVYVLFAQCLDGLFTIRAYRAGEHILRHMHETVDNNARWDLAEQAAGRWLSVRLAWVGGFLTLACALGGIVLRDSLGASAVGLMLSYALNLSFSLIMVTRLTSATENSFNAVERVLHYGRTEPEGGGLDKGIQPPAQWPQDGRVEFSGVCVRYRPDLPDVLTDLSFLVEAKEKVGIVGRTGAGKSSLVSALFRLVQPYRGRVLIDGVDALTLQLHALRRNLGIIPQEPVLLTGSVRYNLDPFGQSTDMEVWAALRQAHLSDYVAALPDRLEAQVHEGGSNFSIGQRQLLCMARALARSCKVLVMDEATAAVDSETDRLIQTSLREAFREATVLTIAHRLHTVIDSTKIMLLASGRLIEFGRPHELLQDAMSAFSALVDSTGEASAAALRAAARAAIEGGDTAAVLAPILGSGAASPSLWPAPPTPFKQASNRFRAAGMAALAAVRVGSAPPTLHMSAATDASHAEPLSLGPAVLAGAHGGGAAAIDAQAGAAVAGTAPAGGCRPSVSAVRVSLDQLHAAVREGKCSPNWQAALLAEHVSPAAWYAELAAVLHALAREADRAVAEMGDDEDTEHVPYARQDSTVLSTQS